MEKKHLDKGIIQSELKLSGKMFTAKSFWGLVLIFAVIWAACSLGPVNNLLWSSICFAVVIGMLTYAYWMQQRKGKAIENNDFCLVEDICVNKKMIEGDTDAYDRYILLFQKRGKYVEHENRQYQNIAVGDTCYLLRIAGSKKIYCVFKKCQWLGLAGFEKRGDVYYPRTGD